jgi:hypothetical protein
MLFMLVSRPKQGMTREQLIERLTRQVHPETWDLIRHGELTNILYKVGDEPGFFALLNASTIENARALLASSAARLEAFDIEIYPVKQFPHFD